MAEEELPICPRPEPAASNLPANHPEGTASCVGSVAQSRGEMASIKPPVAVDAPRHFA